nr:MAG TPA: hypothetical protein [Caudoviricetes sp.]
MIICPNWYVEIKGKYNIFSLFLLHNIKNFI